MSGGCSEVPFNVLKLLKVWTVLLTFCPTMSEYTRPAKTDPDHNNLSPMFDDFAIREVEATEGQTLLLPCTVRYLDDKLLQVSWIRSRDLHILTSGRNAFSSDDRFEAAPSPAGDFWGLRIRGVHMSDTGQYECQVNTDPKMSMAFTLTVLGGGSSVGTNSKWVGQALIKGPREVYVRDGSLATFTCEILPLSVASPQSGEHGVFMTAKPKVRWLHDNKELLAEALDSRYSMNTGYSERSQKIIGFLQLSEVSSKDSGQYTCLQMSVKPASVKLIVEETEHSEAMQRDFPTLSSGNRHISKIGLILLLLLNFPT